MHTIEFDDVQKFAESKARKRNLMWMLCNCHMDHRTWVRRLQTFYYSFVSSIPLQLRAILYLDYFIFFAKLLNPYIHTL
jgi:hypothetical protein